MTHIQQRRDQAALWTIHNPVLMDGESGHEKDTGREKMGDGVTPWNDLPYKFGVDSVAGKTGEVVLDIDDVFGAAPLDSPVLVGSPTAPTPALSDADESIATTAFVKGSVKQYVDGLKLAPLDSPMLTGNPTAPTPALDDNDVSIATTAFVRSLFNTTDTGWLNPAAYGAKGDGVTDDTAAINAAAAAGNVAFHGKRYKINGTLNFPADKSQMGKGSGSTVFVMGNSGKILLGSKTNVPSPQEAGKTGGFSIEGNGGTDIGLHTACVGRGRIMEDIFVYNCVTNVLVEGSQNMLWLGLDVAHGSYGLVLDKGAGGNHFIGLQTLDQTILTLDIRNSGDPTFPPGTYYPSTVGCSDNHFTNCRFEIPAASAQANMFIRAGLRNMFKSCLISGQNLAASAAIVKLGNVGGVGARYTTFEDCLVQGDGVVGAAFSADNTGEYTIVKNCVIANAVVRFKGNIYDAFWLDGVLPPNRPASEVFAPQSGSAATLLSALRGPDPTPWVDFLVATWTASSDPAKLRRVGSRVEFRGIAKAAASGTIPAVMGAVPVPGGNRAPLYSNRGAAAGVSVQVTGTSMLTNVNTNGQEIFLDGLFYDADM